MVVKFVHAADIHLDSALQGQHGLVAHRIPVAERDRLRVDLLAYCERDTWATVELMQTLRRLAA